MKTLLLLSLILFSLAACRPEESISPKAAILSKTKAKLDTIPDKAAFKIKLLKDSSIADETMVYFNHLATCKYSSGGDAPYFLGFGQVSLASVSSDGVDLAINQVPYTPGMSIGLDVRTKTDGIYLLKISYNKMPANIQIWIKDTYKKDSVNVCSGNYSFSAAKADTNSFGKKRFRLILKEATH
ncbi:MAG: hypothetical protein ACHQHN_10775 [Sphingobacteriales bacterium]